MELPVQKDFSEAVQSPYKHYLVDKEGNIFDNLGNWKNKNKASRIKLMIKGSFELCYIGHVVLQTFVGPNPYEVSGGVVVWKDGDKTNNNIENLEWKSVPQLEKNDVFYKPDQQLIAEPTTEALQVQGFVEGRKMPENIED